MKVVFDGVPPDLHTGIEEEIRVQLNSALGSRDPPMIGQFVVTLDFAGFVQRNSPYHSDRVYDPAHDHGIAVARTLPMMEEGELRFVVVIDARRLSLARENRIGRMAVYTHELRHVVDFQCRSTIDGHGWITDVPQQTEEILFENAWKIACEYSGERCAGELLAHVASKLDGTVAFGTTIGLLQTLGTLLSGLEDYLNDNASRVQPRPAERRRDPRCQRNTGPVYPDALRLRLRDRRHRFPESGAGWRSSNGRQISGASSPPGGHTCMTCRNATTENRITRTPRSSCETWGLRSVGYWRHAVCG